MAIRETLLRQFLIIKKVQRFPVSFEEISETLEAESEIQGLNLTISQRTFQRYLEDIRSLYNIDIKCNRSNQNYYIDTKDDEGINNRILEAFNIFQALNFEERISNSVILEYKLKTRTEYLQDLIQAIENRNVITITHKKYWKNESKDYQIHPYFIKEYKRRWYLLARDIGDDNEKSFGLDRVTNIQVSNRKYGEEPFLLVDKLKSCIGINSLDEGNGIEEIILSFNQFQGRFVKASPIHASQEILIDSDKELRIKLSLYITHDLQMELLSYGDSLTVIKPKVLVDRIHNHLLKAVKKY